MNNRTELACLTESDKITDVTVTVTAAYNPNARVLLQKYQPVKQSNPNLYWPETREQEQAEGHLQMQRVAGDEEVGATCSEVGDRPHVKNKMHKRC